MSNPNELRNKADELEKHASELRQAHRKSQGSSSSGGDSGEAFFGAIVWLLVIAGLLNSCG